MAELCPIGTPYRRVRQHEPIKASLVGGGPGSYKCSGPTQLAHQCVPLPSLEALVSGQCLGLNYQVVLKPQVRAREVPGPGFRGNQKPVLGQFSTYRMSPLVNYSICRQTKYIWQSPAILMSILSNKIKE